jgi:hypothetical protein
MATEQLLLRLPEELVRKFRRIVPERQRSAFVRKLLEQALAANLDEDIDPLYLVAMAVEQDSRLIPVRDKTDSHGGVPRSHICGSLARHGDSHGGGIVWERR